MALNGGRVGRPVFFYFFSRFLPSRSISQSVLFSLQSHFRSQLYNSVVCAYTDTGSNGKDVFSF